VKSNGRTLLAAACCLMLILLAGCTALSSATVKQETLEERVNHYMQAQMDGKWDRAYSFFDSSSRERETRESYVNRTRKLSNRGFSVVEIKMLPSGDQATVKVKTDVQYMGYKFEGVSQTQNWVREGGEWFVQWLGNAAPFPSQQKRQ
jgi:hypothetical protein